jgi:hypothetical protein
VHTRLLAAVPLLAAALAMTATADELPTATTPVPLPAALKTPLVKRVTIEKPAQATLEDLVKRLADDNKMKVEFDPAFFKEYPEVTKRKINVPVVRDLRLDILLDGLFREAGAVPACTVKKDVLVFTKPADAIVTKPNKMQAVQTVLQPPDAGHTAAATALKKKLATKTDIEASTDTPVPEFLVGVAKKYEFTFQLRDDLFRAEGVPVIGQKKLTIKAAKGVTLDAILRETLGSVGADYAVDGYGNLSVIPKSAGPKK